MSTNEKKYHESFSNSLSMFFLIIGKEVGLMCVHTQVESRAERIKVKERGDTESGRQVND